jgi:hypothetical protein
MMFRLLFFRLSRRRAVATIIGGLIILSLILTALGTMVFVSQQYNQYQQVASKMAQYENQAQSENLVANYPGLTANLAWSGCGGCNMYNMSLSNVGGVGVQIVRIYITSTVSPGCTISPTVSLGCILNPSSSTPTSTSSAFQQSKQFLNAGEVNHAVLLYLPCTSSSNCYSLPSGAANENTILIVTSRGNVFSFQWPFPIQVGGQSQAAFSAGIVKVAYQGTSPGYDSKNEPGPVAGGSGGKVGTGYCHSESVQSYPAGAGYAEELTGINYASVGDSGVLWLVNPWVTQTIAGTAANGPSTNTTTLYLTVNITNTGVIPFTVAGGSIDLTWYGSNHIDGSLIGVYYGAAPGAFYAIGSTQTIAVGKSFIAIFRVTTFELDNGGGGTWPPANDGSVTFWGGASLTDATEDKSFVGGVSLSSGLWIPYSC